MWFRDLALLEEIRGLRKDIVELKSRKAVLAREADLTEEVIRLKKDISDLEINKAKIKEGHDKEERELRHMIGLEKKRQEVELVQGKKEAELSVREQGLVADQKRFADEMGFQRARFEQEVGYLKEMMKEILGRLPNVEVALSGKTGRK